MKTLYEELREERKKLQDQGKLPAWMTTNGYQLFKEKYLWDCSNFKEQAKRIAKVAASHTDDPKHWAKKFYTVIWNGWLACSTPVLANMGTTRGCPVSCSGGTVTDSVQGFYEARLEAAILTKNGFGTSAYLGDIRPRGTAISTGGVGSGILPELKAFIQVSRDVTQGGVRRGAWAGYIDIDHGDFWEIATYMVNFPDDLNIGWNISTEFINRLQSGDPEAISRYQRALKVKCTTGKGYFWFVDKVNALRPECYKHYNRVNKASNLCFTGDTLVAVADGSGVARIDKLALESAGEVKFPVYSSRFDTVKKKWIQEVKSAVAFKTGTEKVIILTLSDLTTFKCTPYHLLAVSDGGYVRAMDSVGESLVPYVDPEGGVTEVEHIEVVSIFDIGEVQDVYDLTVQDNHNFNIVTGRGLDSLSRHAGILVHNCTEISLSSDEDHTFSCVLSSVNLSKYDEWKDTDTIFVSTVFLDCVAQEFIQIGKKIPSLEKIVRYTEKSRALGLGTLGFHTYLQQKSIPMESLEAHMENNTIFKDLHDKSLEASQWMAKEWGEPEWCKGFGIRNTHLSSIAPNMSSSLICGGVSQGIEPVMANVFQQGSAGGEMNRINPVLLELMKAKGVYTEEAINAIGFNKGSVQDVEWLTPHEKAVFKTAFEIDQRVLLRLASTRQKFICQAQSLNLFFSAEEEEAYISEIHKEAFLDPNIKALYYLRSSSGIQASKGDCEACEG